MPKLSIPHLTDVLADLAESAAQGNDMNPMDTRAELENAGYDAAAIEQVVAAYYAATPEQMRTDLRNDRSAMDLNVAQTVERAMRSLRSLKHEIEIAEGRLHEYAIGKASIPAERGLLEANAASVNLACAFMALHLQAQSS